MRPIVRKLTLTAHLVCSLGWIGAVLAYIVLGLAAARGSDPPTVRAAWIGMDLIGWSAVVPLAAGSLATGIAISLATPWGLFRHYWVLISLLLTALCTLVLILHMPSVTATADLARAGVLPAGPQGQHGAHASGDLFHPSAGLIILLVITLLNVFKPRGLTPYGWRKQQESRPQGAPPT